MDINLQATEEKLKNVFWALKTREDIAEMLELPNELLSFYLYKNKERNYKTFEIPKKRGGFRQIEAPVSSIKIIQRKLADVLYYIYESPLSAYGFCKYKDIVGNARQHKNRSFVFNIDLLDFFPTINFGRVRGL